MSEDAAVGSRFYRLSAVDPDVAAPEDLVFSLVEAESAVSEAGKPVDRPNEAYKVSVRRRYRNVLLAFCCARPCVDFAELSFMALHIAALADQIPVPGEIYFVKISSVFP